MKKKVLILLASLLSQVPCHAIIIIPIPNIAFPGSLSKIRDALEKSSDTKALATVGESKLFGSRTWVWGQASGKMTQANADEQAMRRCEAALLRAKTQTTGGQPLYDFGSNQCELYKFINVTLNLPEPVESPVAATNQIPVATENQTQPQAPNPLEPNKTSPLRPPQNTSTSDPAAGGPQNTQQGEPKPTTGLIQKLKDLDALYKQNLITKEEYEKKRKQLLDSL